MSTNSNMAYCPRCTKHYPAGDKTGHCAVCHETFYGLAAFETHRQGAHGPQRHCVKPGLDPRMDYWQDDKQRWHLGKQLTPEETARIWGNR